MSVQGSRGFIGASEAWYVQSGLAVAWLITVLHSSAALEPWQLTKSGYWSNGVVPTKNVTGSNAGLLYVTLQLPVDSHSWQCVVPSTIDDVS